MAGELHISRGAGNSSTAKTWSDVWSDVLRSFTAFLAVPLVTVLAFTMLAVLTYILDRHPPNWLAPTRSFLQQHFFTDKDVTTTLLGTITGAVITLTSITYSLLLLTVQQTATALTNQVVDQFLRRRLNQVYLGSFVGVSVFALCTLTSYDIHTMPVLGATMAAVLTFGALITLLLLLYTTLNQMRPERIIEAIHDLALQAWPAHQRLLARTRREPQLTSAAAVLTVGARTNGYVAQNASRACRRGHFSG